MKLIGRIKYETRGAYDTAASYRAMDVVLHSGSLWEALKDTTGNPPPENQRNEDGSPASNEFWKLFLPGALGDDYIKKTDVAKAPTETEHGKVGVVMPDGKTIQIDENGMMTGTPLDFMGTLKELQEGIASGEITEGMIGYIEGTPDNPEDPDHPNSMLIHIDDYLSLISSNAVQNKIITAELNLIKELVEQNKQLIEETKALRSSVEAFGLSKICPIGVTDVAEANSMVLGAWEKNASVNGSISNIFSNKVSELRRDSVCAKGEFSDLNDIIETGIYVVSPGTSHAPYDNYYGVATVFNSIAFCLQLAVDVGGGHMATRIKNLQVPSPEWTRWSNVQYH